MKKTINSIKNLICTLKKYLVKDTDSALWAKIIMVIELLLLTIAEGILLFYVLPHLCIEQITTGFLFKYNLLLLIELIFCPFLQICIYRSIKEELEYIEE